MQQSKNFENRTTGRGRASFFAYKAHENVKNLTQIWKISGFYLDDQHSRDQNADADDLKTVKYYILCDYNLRDR